MINSLKIKNFKSIKDQKIDLGHINILIGRNGAGKSNLIDFFYMLRKIVDQDFQSYVANKGFANNILHFGRKYSSFISSEVSIDQIRYSFALKPTENASFYFNKEKCETLDNKQRPSKGIETDNIILNRFPSETRLYSMYYGSDTDFYKSNNSELNTVISKLKKLQVYHFHDTGKSALIKSPQLAYDIQFFKPDGSNLAPFLLYLKESYPKHFFRIEQTVKRIAPFIDKLNPVPDARNKEMIRLDWMEKGNDYPFYISSLSDGTIRTICLATLFFQPEPPEIIIIDEPELGLHPSAIYILSGLIKMAAAKGTQVILSTQSVSIIDQFSPEDILIVERESDLFDHSKSHSVFKRLDTNQLKEWISEYSLSEIINRNLVHN